VEPVNDFSQFHEGQEIYRRRANPLMELFFYERDPVACSVKKTTKREAITVDSRDGTMFFRRENSASHFLTMRDFFADELKNLERMKMKKEHELDLINERLEYTKKRLAVK